MDDGTLQCHIKPAGNEESTLYRNNYIGKTQEERECNKSKREGNIIGSEVQSHQWQKPSCILTRQQFPFLFLKSEVYGNHGRMKPDCRLQWLDWNLKKSHYMRFFSSNNGFHRAPMTGSTPAPKNALATSFSMPHSSLSSGAQPKKQTIIFEDSSYADLKHG